MVINSPYHSSMGKEIEKACKILDAFFDPKVDADKAIPFELIQNAAGIAFLTVIKAGMIWTGKVGTGVVLSRLDDGAWSPPSGIGTAGVGFGAEIGGEIIDFMIILGSPSAVQSFKKGTQLSVGAGLELAVGPVGRAGGANVNAGGSGFSSNYTYSHAKGLFAGVGLHGSTIMVRGEMNNEFYGKEVSPMQILSGHVAPPPGSCDRLYETLQRACFGDMGSSGRSGLSEPMQAIPPSAYGRSSMTDYSDQRRSFNSSSGSSSSTSYNPPSSRTAAPSNYDPVARNSILGSSADSDVSKETDPRLRRYSSYKNEKDLYAQFAKKAPTHTSQPSAYAPAQANTGYYAQPTAAAAPTGYYSQPATTSYAQPTAPSYAQPTGYAAPVTSSRAAPSMPPAAEGAETKQVFGEVIQFMTTRVPHADLSTFKDNCRRFGQDQMSIDAFFFYLNSICTSSLLKELMPKLVRLLPTPEKRVAMWDLYVKHVY
ncbi:hypothetical protein SDRG_01624 [Saprolegnia diclina VS20]|uniref:Uncharacterized protein n=1 Tax=Saprolegnia diclina (strain VS20) TaxID=1156394 RepID=T0R3X1_SAPDV|nr:hypothetical protein SDRG_01624 [Saprolegnia diclina VS20]EQC41666.1 hypothetical protein SDRG_01624 [Saprolegnia diclina VS20]|eukprot:XP_008605380.1 hypothetical protein SDRG_01624 [Saprolegnia diclina VS20]